MKKTLEENAKIFDEANELRASTEMPNPYILTDWREFKRAIDKYDKRILSLEAEHMKTVKKLSKNEKIVKSILPYILDKEPSIQREALFVIVESKNKKLIHNMVEKTLHLTAADSNVLYGKIGFISVDAFRVLFDVVKEIGFIQPQSRHILTKNILTYIALLQLTDLAKKFTKLDDFPMDLQKSILDKLSFFEEFKDIILKAYIEKHPQYTDDPTANGINIAISLLLFKEEKAALKIMRDKHVITEEYGGTGYLTKLGDKEDGLIIVEALKEGYVSGAWKKQGYTYRSRWLYEKLKDAYDISNPLLIAGMIDIFPEIVKDMHNSDEDIQMYAEELYDIVSTMLGRQFGFPDQKYCDELAKKLSDEKLPVQCWKEHPKKDMRKKFLAAENEPYSIFRSLLFELTKKAQPLYIALYDRIEFIVMTGERFAPNGAGYYTSLKPEIEKMLHFLEAHQENYKDGRWFRYGRYVDEPYTPMGRDEIKTNKTSKDFEK